MHPASPLWLWYDRRAYLVSRWGLCRRHQRQYFFSSRRPVVFRLFFVVL